MTLDDVRIGSVVIVRGSFGNGRPVQGTVDEVDDNIKNGNPGIGYETTDGDSHWAYIEQVSSVVKY